MDVGAHSSPSSCEILPREKRFGLLSDTRSIERMPRSILSALATAGFDG